MYHTCPQAQKTTHVLLGLSDSSLVLSAATAEEVPDGLGLGALAARAHGPDTRSASSSGYSFISTVQ